MGVFFRAAMSGQLHQRLMRSRSGRLLSSEICLPSQSAFCRAKIQYYRDQNSNMVALLLEL